MLGRGDFGQSIARENTNNILSPNFLSIASNVT